jgi:hypothetical protein
MRHGDKADATISLTALGVDLEGNKEVLSLRAYAEVQAKLVGIWQQPSKQEAVVHLEAFKAKSGKRYPEAVRSLAELVSHQPERRGWFRRGWFLRLKRPLCQQHRWELYLFGTRKRRTERVLKSPAEPLKYSGGVVPPLLSPAAVGDVVESSGRLDPSYLCYLLDCLFER